MKKLFTLLILIVIFALPACQESTDTIPEMTTPEIENQQGDTEEDDEENPAPPSGLGD